MEHALDRESRDTLTTANELSARTAAGSTAADNANKVRFIGARS